MGGLAQVHGGALATLCLQPGLPLGTLGSPRVRVRQQADLGNLEGNRSWDPLEQKPGWHWGSSSSVYGRCGPNNTG